MDHHGFLTAFRTISAVAQQVQVQRKESINTTWSWAGTPVMYPESKCPFCKGVIQSQGIWLFDGLRQERLIGALFPTEGGKIQLVMPSHPHDTGGGYICFGGHPNGAAVLASAPNLSDVPMGKFYVPRWIKRYWGHECKQMLKYLRDWGELDRLEELETI